MLRKSLASLIVLFTMIAHGVGFANLAVPPAPTSSIYVQDYAAVLSADAKREINRLGASLRQATKAQIVVVTVKSLEGAPLENYSLELLRKWGVGDRQLNNGVVLLVAVDDKASRIEVGYGLEGALPDGKTGRIQDEVILPYFRQGDYIGGVLNGYLALVKVVADEYKVAPPDGAAAPVKAAQPSGENPLSPLMTLLAGIGIVCLVVLDFMFFGGRFTMLILMMLRSRGGGGGGGFGGGSGGGGGSSRKW